MKRLSLLVLLLCTLSSAALAQRVALRTDLLLWGTTTPNAGVEVSIQRHFTMALNGAYNAWKFGNDMKLNLYPVSYTHLDVYKRQGVYILQYRTVFNTHNVVADRSLDERTCQPAGDGTCLVGVGASDG